MEGIRGEMSLSDTKSKVERCPGISGFLRPRHVPSVPKRKSGPACSKRSKKLFQNSTLLLRELFCLHRNVTASHTTIDRCSWVWGKRTPKGRCASLPIGEVSNHSTFSRWFWARSHDMPAMIRYLNHWATAAPIYTVAPRLNELIGTERFIRSFGVISKIGV
ncbi:hypothetical protein TNCV_730681 [Trichonephila clavipes]|nr:hypothetical protein TNCV_730681 [Trichonephila clavipes]